MLDRVLSRVSQRVAPGTYEGVLAGLIPADAVLAYLAKRSYAMYRLWDLYHHRTSRLFHRAAVDGACPPALLAELRQRGYVVLPDAFDSSELAAARRFILALAERVREHAAQTDPAREQPVVRWSDDGFPHELVRRTGRIRIYLPKQRLTAPGVPTLIRSFVDLPRCRAIAAAYFGTSAILANQPYLMAEVLEPAPNYEPWHIDCIRPTIKAFLYLTDVDQERGPLRYIPGSHQVDSERHRLFYRICKGGLGSAYFDAAECARLDALGHSVLAHANTLIVFDNRGLHAGSCTRSDTRVVLVNGYRPLAAARINPRMFRDPRPARYPSEMSGA